MLTVDLLWAHGVPLGTTRMRFGGKHLSIDHSRIACGIVME